MSRIPTFPEAEVNRLAAKIIEEFCNIVDDTELATGLVALASAVAQIVAANSQPRRVKHAIKDFTDAMNGFARDNIAALEEIAANE